MMTRWPILISISLTFCLSAMVRGEETNLESGPARVHLLELFTSEGCSSCPPAEAWLTQLKQANGLWHDFVPLAFHVDYWDHLGWRDRFATKEWTTRQQTYAARWNAGSVYTPGFVLDGRESQAQLPRTSKENVGTLRLKTNGDDAHVSFTPSKNEARACEVYVAALGFGITADVAAGENKGRKLSHDFVVLSLQKAPLPADATEVKFKIDNSHSDKIGALAAWITYPGDPTPIQAIGGYLPK
jgi:hypothetical protein